jgi:hypothetical protein
MQKLKLIVASIILFSFCLNAGAQQISADTAVKNKNVKSLYYNAGLQYISNLTFAGRRDASSVPILLPTFTLISTKGFFLNAIGYFDLNGNSSQAEGLSITPGYVFSFDKKKEYGGAISATKYFIASSSAIILSSFNATIDGQLYANPSNIVKLTVGASYRFDKNNKTDIINDAELSKEIWVLKAGKSKTDGLKITPDVTLYTGTQSFYQTYYTSSVVQRAVTTPGSNSSLINILFPNQPKQTIIYQTVTTQKQQEVKNYGLLALSGSAQVVYAIKPWQISFTPYLIKPFNQVNYLNASNQNGLYFLFTTGASVTF